MKFVLTYESAPDFMAKVPLHIEAHRTMWRTFQQAGTLLMIGPFPDATGGSMAIFTTREAAEQFVRDDPFVAHGVVARWTIREWKEAILPL